MSWHMRNHVKLLALRNVNYFTCFLCRISLCIMYIISWIQCYKHLYLACCENSISLPPNCFLVYNIASYGDLNIGVNSINCLLILDITEAVKFAVTLRWKYQVTSILSFTGMLAFLRALSGIIKMNLETCNIVRTEFTCKNNSEGAFHYEVLCRKSVFL